MAKMAGQRESEVELVTGPGLTVGRGRAGDWNGLQLEWVWLGVERG